MYKVARIVIGTIAPRITRTVLKVCFLGLFWHSSIASASTLFGDVLRADDSAVNNAYGYSLSISGDSAAVGAWFTEGAVYILRFDPALREWQQTQKITTPDVVAGRVNFGFSTWLDGNQLVVGAPNIFSGGLGAITGYAFIYERDSDGIWSLTASIPGINGESDDFLLYGSLGREVVVDQGRVMISRSDVDETSSVLVYEKNPLSGDWLETATLLVDSGATDSGGGDIAASSFDITALALDGNRLVVGVDEASADGTSSFAARIYDFDPTLGNWNQTDRIDRFNGLTSEQMASTSSFFGLALEGQNLLITGSSGAYLFQYSNQSGQWLQDANFTADVTINVSNERQAADIEGSRVVIADSDDVGATVYERDAASGHWTEVVTLSTASLNLDSPVVTSVDLEGDNVLLGTPYIEEFTGAVVGFRLDDSDSDGIPAADDNCPSNFNPTQANFDEDLLGDVCDLDDDNDGVDDVEDAFPLDPSRHNAPDIDPAGMAPETPFPAWPFGRNIELEADFRWPATANASFYVIEVQHNGSIRAYEPAIPGSTACRDSECLYIKSDAVLNGANRWRLRAGNEAGLSEWSPWSEFFVGLSSSSNGDDNNDVAFTRLPVTPSPQQPVGDGYTEGLDYLWEVTPGALRYAVEVQHQGEIRAYEPSLTASEACVSGVCRYIKSDAARIGENRWRLRAINNIGSSAWSDWVDFTVENKPANTAAFIPEAPLPLAPAGDQALQTSEYRWSEVTGATVYAIEIQHNGVIRAYNENVDADQSCDPAGCVFRKEDAALPGENRWRVRSGNANGFSEWSDWLVFVVQS